LVRVALSIAGSDSAGGAGIQADIKTIASLGVYPCTVITAITAQNTKGISHILSIDAYTVRKQIESILNDITVHSIKIGLVMNEEIISAVSRSLLHKKIPVVLDPIITSTSGTKFLSNAFLGEFRASLIPLSDLITPNIPEAEKLSGIRILNESSLVEAANYLLDLGAKNVIIKGGHVKDSKIIFNVLVNKKGEKRSFNSPRIRVDKIHGNGCNFSSAVTAFMARNYSIAESCYCANLLVSNSIMDAIKIGKGMRINSPYFSIYDNALRYEVIQELNRALKYLTKIPSFGSIIPETQSNFTYALPFAKGIKDVAGVDGRIVKLIHTFKPTSNVEFGVSQHVARAVIAYMRFNMYMRSAINIKLDTKLIGICKELFIVSSYDRLEESPKLNSKEGTTISWGISRALEKVATAEVIYHTGGFGKEPMILVFGENPLSVVKKIAKILKKY
jgi:hydroxymethylpyrimidine kinase / phosphomethylpyrimidine kinase / thiamine-phosphate diphosphorylase